MKKIYTIYDEKTVLFNTPYYSLNDNEAIRHFASLLLDEQTMLNKFPEDFKLYTIGELDDKTGVITPLTLPELIVNGDDLKNKIERL